MIQDLLEGAMAAELDIHLQAERESTAIIKANRKNGSTPKIMKIEQSSFVINTPRDRQGTFTPQIIEK